VPVDYGVRWLYRDGTQVDSWGYSKTGAYHMLDVAHTRGWQPQAVAVVTRSYQEEPTVTVEHYRAPCDAPSSDAGTPGKRRSRRAVAAVPARTSYTVGVYRCAR
jgi:hypothetical protein